MKKDLFNPGEEGIPQHIFDDLRDNAIAIWGGRYDDEHGYLSEKITMIGKVTNNFDNWGTFVGMFDPYNQGMLRAMVSDETRPYVDYWAGYPWA